MITYQNQQKMHNRLANDIPSLLRAVDVLETYAGTSTLACSLLSTGLHVFD